MNFHVSPRPILVLCYAVFNWLVVWTKPQAQFLPGVRLAGLNIVVWPCQFVSHGDAMALMMDPSEVDLGGCSSAELVGCSLVPGHGCHLLVVLVRLWLVLFTGLLDVGSTRVSLMDEVLVHPPPVFCLESGENTEGFHFGITWFDYFMMIGACSGLGGVSPGALDAGVAGIHSSVVTDSYGSLLVLPQVHVDGAYVTGDFGDLLVCAKADMFGSSVRVPVCLLEKMVDRGGVADASVEPGKTDGHKVLQEYMVSWASRLGQDLMQMIQTYPAVVGHARIAVWCGLGVSSDLAQGEHKVVCPDMFLLPQGDLGTYIVGPFPFGIDRQGIQASWPHLPVQPAAPQPGRGTILVVQVVDEPHCAFVHTGHGEIVLSMQYLGELTDRNSGFTPIAAPAALARWGGNCGHAVDSWTQHDTWQKLHGQ